MSRPRLLLVACRVFERELEVLARSAKTEMHLHYIEIALHEQPGAQLRAALQEETDRNLVLTLRGSRRIAFASGSLSADSAPSSARGKHVLQPFCWVPVEASRAVKLGGTVATVGLRGS